MAARKEQLALNLPVKIVEFTVGRTTVKEVFFAYVEPDEHDPAQTVVKLNISYANRLPITVMGGSTRAFSDVKVTVGNGVFLDVGNKTNLLRRFDSPNVDAEYCRMLREYLAILNERIRDAFFTKCHMSMTVGGSSEAVVTRECDGKAFKVFISDTRQSDTDWVFIRNTLFEEPQEAFPTEAETFAVSKNAAFNTTSHSVDLPSYKLTTAYGLKLAYDPFTNTLKCGGVKRILSKERERIRISTKQLGRAISEGIVVVLEQDGTAHRLLLTDNCKDAALFAQEVSEWVETLCIEGTFQK